MSDDAFDDAPVDQPKSAPHDREVNGPLDGTLRFTFYESSSNYSVERIPPADSDSDEKTCPKG